MKLLIDNKPPYDEKFIRWLIKQIKAKLFSEVDLKLLNALNEKFKLLNINLDINHCFIAIVNNLTYSKNKNYYHIFFNDKRITGTQYTCTEVIKLINYGTLEVLGYKIFSEIFQLINNNLDKYVYMYSLAPGVI